MRFPQYSVSVGLVVLVVLSSTVPAVQLSDAGSRIDTDSPTAGTGEPTQGDNRSASARSAKRAAIAQLEGISAGWWFERNRNRAIRLLNGSRSAYRDEIRVSRSVFADDRRAIGIMATLVWVNTSAADRATALVVSADLQTTNTSIRDAKRSLALVGDRVGTRGDLDRAEATIDSAIRSRDRALTVLDRSRDKPWRAISQRRAIRHLGVAWKKAQSAIDVLDDASDPIVSIRTRTDPPGNESGLGVRTITGSVSDVRAYELDRVRVEIDGIEVRSVPLNSTTAPAQNASFVVTRHLVGATATVELTVTDVSSRGQPRVGRGIDRPAEANQWGWRHHIRGAGDHRFPWWRSRDEHLQKHSASVRFDGDGLPDRFESTVLGTDPLDPDSDASATGNDEGGNGLPDGGEDFDGDGLIAFSEFRLGTDPLANDSDADGLPDQVEAVRPGLFDPTDPDSDGDGSPDGRADIDGDGLSAKAEWANGTSISRSDSDRDGVDDGAEVLVHGTNASRSDTDGDGLADGVELRLGSDPLNPDSDDDGESDGDESYQTTAMDPDSGVEVSLRGTGDLARFVDIETVEAASTRPFLASPVVKLQNHTAFDQATVRLPIIENRSRDYTNLSVFTWESGTGEPWHPIPSTLDAETDTVAANVTSFSFFSVMDPDHWRSTISDSVSLGWPRFEPFEDLSGWEVQGDTAVIDGRLVVSGGSDPEPGREIVVDANGGADFNRIQPALEAAVSGDTIVVNSGTYPESIRVEKSIRLLGEDVRLDASEMEGFQRTGVHLRGGQEIELRGFTINGFGMGIEDNSQGADVDLADVSIRDCGVGVYAWQTVGSWTMSGLEVSDCTDGGIYAAYGAGDWMLEDVDVSIGGGDALSAKQHHGDWTLTDVELSQSAEGIDARGAVGTWVLENVNVSATEDTGILADNAEGDWRIRAAELSGNDEHGLSIAGIRGEWSIAASRIVDNQESGIVVEVTEGELAVTGSQIHDNGRMGIETPGDEIEVTAVHNWWGQSTGPEPGQVTEGVPTSPFCETPDCASAAMANRRPVSDNEFRIGVRSRRGSQIVESRPESWARRSLAIPPGVDAELTAHVDGRAVDGGVGMVRVVSGTAAVELVEIGASDGAGTASLDVSRFAGESVKVEVSATGDSHVAVDWLDLAIDTDGDGLRDAVEEADLGMPAGPRPGASLAALDPANPDTDGDGLTDGEELTEVVTQPGADAGLGVSFHAAGATSDPTRENSDGGGLNDGEEREVGSDPFVLETLVAGFTLPTMTHGPGDTLMESEPMTMASVTGILVGESSESDLIGWPSHQYYDPIFCIKEFTAGPGCAPAWMSGVELREDRHYLYIPFVVYLQTNVNGVEIPYEIVTKPSVSANPVKIENSSGVLTGGASQSGYIVYELRDEQAGVEGFAAAFRSIGQIGLELDMSSSMFYRGESTSVTRRYSVSTDTLLPQMDEVLERAKFILSQGITIAFAAQDGYEVAVKTGSKTKGALVFLFELAKGQIDTPPKTPSDFNRGVAERGLTSFQEMIETVSSQIEQEIFGEGTVRPVGPTIIHQN